MKRSTTFSPVNTTRVLTDLGPPKFKSRRHYEGYMAKRRICATRQVRTNGTFGFGGGAQWIEDQPAQGDIDADNDSVMNPALQFVVDLSEIASHVLGRQISMTRGVTIHSLGVAIRPVDDITDNDESAFFAGRIQAYPVTSHALKALSLARQMEKFIEGPQMDSDSFFLSTDKDYLGLRLGWTTSPESQIKHQTQGWPEGGNYTYSRVFTAYDQMTASDHSNALWNGRSPNPVSWHWVSALASGIGQGDSPPPGGNGADWQQDTRIEVFPLLRGLVEFSSGDEEGTVDDDYTVHIHVEFTVEE